MSDLNPAALAELARQVSEQNVTMNEAFEEERAAEAALLEKIVESVRPALRALSNRLKASERVWWPTNVETANEKTFHPERGIRLAGSGPEQDYPRANDGSIEGRDLVLLDDGSFATLDWSGNWTRWQGRTSTEESALTRITTAEVVTEWNVDVLAAALAKALEAQASGRTEKTTATAKARAEKLRSVSTLLVGRK
ncbi:MAG: hypothetical protein IPN83_00040 [Holophagales bacterium]|nr:hypothetical protein [Holophagales bacterium]